MSGNPMPPMSSLSQSESLDGLEVVPGFLMPVAELFIKPASIYE